VTALPERRRRRTWYALAAGLLSVGSIPVFATAGWRAIRDSRAARDVTRLAEKIPLTPTALLGATDDDGTLTALAVLALRPEGAGGTVVMVPVGSGVTGADGGRTRLADTYASGGVEALQTDVESLLLVSVSTVSIVDEAQLAQFLAPVGTVEVDLPSQVLDGSSLASDPAAGSDEPTTTADDESDEEATATTADESDEDTTTTTEPDDEATADDESTTSIAADVVAEAGPQTLTPEQAAEALVAAVPGLSETTRLPDTLAVWQGIVAAVGSGRPDAVPVDVPGGVMPADMGSFLSALWGGTVTVWQLSATPATATDNPAGEDLLNVDLAEAVMVMATIAPSAVSAVLEGASVQIDSAFTDWRVTRAAVAVLIYIGANVLLVRQEAGTPPAETEVSSTNAASSSLAAEYSKALAGGDVRSVEVPVEGIEIQIVLGQSFADLQSDSTESTLLTVPANDSDED
jgi:hypothetical protein